MHFCTIESALHSFNMWGPAHRGSYFPSAVSEPILRSVLVSLALSVFCRMVTYFHTSLYRVYFLLGNVNNYLCLECVLHWFVFLVSVDLCILSFRTIHCVVVEVCPVFWSHERCCHSLLGQWFVMYMLSTVCITHYFHGIINVVFMALFTLSSYRISRQYAVWFLSVYPCQILSLVRRSGPYWGWGGGLASSQFVCCSVCICHRVGVGALIFFEQCCLCARHFSG
jgi:hypothetical protein